MLITELNGDHGYTDTFPCYAIFNHYSLDIYLFSKANDNRYQFRRSDEKMLSTLLWVFLLTDKY